MVDVAEEVVSQRGVIEKKAAESGLRLEINESALAANDGHEKSSFSLILHVDRAVLAKKTMLACLRHL